MTPVVFVHGLIGHLRAVAAALAADGRPTLAPDLLGYGSRSDVPDTAVTLHEQAQELRRCIAAEFGNAPVDLLGHSAGGAIAMLHAHSHPDQVRRVVSMEGNFSLKDAFWSASLARMGADEADAMLVRMRADRAGWLTKAGIAVNDGSLALASELLGFQSASTLRAMGRSIVEVTGAAAYADTLRSVFQRHPVYLLSGQRSLAGWDVPDWALSLATGSESLPGLGHMAMFEDLAAFMIPLRRWLG